jgi:ankyrin repeat protein
MYNKINVVKYLIARGANVNNEENDRQENPLANASFWGNVEIAEILVSAGADITYDDYHTFKKACFNNRLDVVKYLYNQGVDVKKLKYTVLMTAIQYELINIVKFLVEVGFRIESMHITRARRSTTEIYNYITNSNRGKDFLKCLAIKDYLVSL